MNLPFGKWWARVLVEASVRKGILGYKSVPTRVLGQREQRRAGGDYRTRVDRNHAYFAAERSAKAAGMDDEQARKEGQRASTTPPMRFRVGRSTTPAFGRVGT